VEKLVLESDDNRIVGDEEDEKKGEAGIRHTVPVLVDEVFQTRFDKPEDIFKKHFDEYQKKFT